MPWNNQGGGGPWGSGPKGLWGSGSPPPGSSPPDLEELEGRLALVAVAVPVLRHQ